jgi:hypothetical protein
VVATFQLSADFAYAAGFTYQIQLPAYTSSPTSSEFQPDNSLLGNEDSLLGNNNNHKASAPFVLNGIVFPYDSLSSVLRGSLPTYVDIGMVPVQVQRSNSASDPPLVGSYGQVASVRIGSQANQTSFADQDSVVTVVFTIDTNPLTMSVIVQHLSALQLIAQTGALVGTIVLILRVIMHQFEKYGIREGQVCCLVARWRAWKRCRCRCCSLANLVAIGRMIMCRCACCARRMGAAAAAEPLDPAAAVEGGVPANTGGGAVPPGAPAARPEGGAYSDAPERKRGSDVELPAHVPAHTSGPPSPPVIQQRPAVQEPLIFVADVAEAV